MLRRMPRRGRRRAAVKVVYVDVLFAINLIVDYFLLRAAGAVLHRPAGRLRMLLGAAAGAAYASFMFFPDIAPLYSAAARLAVSLLIVGAAFRWQGLRAYLSQAAVFYALSLLFGGAVMAVYIFASPPGMLVRGGAVYFDIRPLTLIAGSCGFYIFFTLLSRLTGAPAARCLREIKITVGDKNVSLTALSDTGDTLGDPVSGLPVIVAEYGAVSALIPKEFTRAFRSGGVPDAADAEGSQWAGRLRMIPFGSLKDAHGLLPAFRADDAAVKMPGRAGAGKRVSAGPVIVAVTARSLGEDFSALAGAWVQSPRPAAKQRAKNKKFDFTGDDLADAAGENGKNEKDKKPSAARRRAAQDARVASFGPFAALHADILHKRARDPAGPAEGG
jgi:stage II sporulation protein GA (sporulation sigma-E factor processing peptidase)